jgi:hypothetical protein
VAECIEAFIGWIKSHLVRKKRNAQEKVGSRDDRLKERPDAVTISLHLDLLEVRRLMTEGRSLPGEGHWGPTPGNGSRMLLLTHWAQNGQFPVA